MAVVFVFVFKVRWGRDNRERRTESPSTSPSLSTPLSTPRNLKFLFVSYKLLFHGFG